MVISECINNISRETDLYKLPQPELVVDPTRKLLQQIKLNMMAN